MMPAPFFDPGERLLSERIPVQFFGLALLAHLVFWLGLGLRGEEVLTYYTGNWAVLSVLHVLTVGVFLTVALGASLQMLPVALTMNAPKSFPCDLVFVCLASGGGLLIMGFEYVAVPYLQYGAFGLSLAVVIYVWMVVPMLRHAVAHGHARAFLAVAMLCLLGLVGAGSMIALNYASGFLDEPLAMTRSHAVLGSLGVMGFLVFGFSQILVPMLALARGSASRLPIAAWLCGLLALGCAVMSAWIENAFIQHIAAGAFLLAAVFHVFDMRRFLANRMKRNLGTAFILIRASWGALCLSALIAWIGVLLPDWEAGPILVGWLVLVGWLLSVLTGVLQRIIPFLASMNAGRDGGVPIPVSRLTPERLFEIHVVAHLGAVFLGGLSIGFGWPWLMTGAAVLGAVGACVFLSAALTTGLRLRRLRQR
jgi:hypothetical protein